MKTILLLACLVAAHLDLFAQGQISGGITQPSSGVPPTAASDPTLITCSAGQVVQFQGSIYTCPTPGGTFVVAPAVFPTQSANTITGNNTGSTASPTGLTPAQSNALTDASTTARTLLATITSPIVNGVISIDGHVYTTVDQAVTAAAALNTAGANATINLGPGTYTLASPVTLPTNGTCMNFVGSGGSSTLINYTGSATTVPLFSVANLGTVGSYCVIKNFGLNANDNAPGLKLGAAANWTIEGLNWIHLNGGTTEAVALGDNSGTGGVVELTFKDSKFAGHQSLATYPVIALTVTTGSLSAASLTSGGAGYNYPSITVYGCTVAPVLTATQSGGVLQSPITIVSAGSGCGASPYARVSDTPPQPYGFHVYHNAHDSHYSNIVVANLGTVAGFELENGPSFNHLHPYVQQYGIQIPSNAPGMVLANTQCDTSFAYCFDIEASGTAITNTEHYYNTVLGTTANMGDFHVGSSVLWTNITGSVCGGQQTAGGYNLVLDDGGQTNFMANGNNIGFSAPCDGSTPKAWMGGFNDFGGNVGSARNNIGSISAGFGALWVENQGTPNANPTAVIRCASGQTGNDMEWRNNAGTVATMSCAGNLVVNAESGTGSAPTISGCGTGVTTPNAGSTNLSGSVTEGTAATGCTITWATAFTTTPISSNVTSTNGTITYTFSTTAIVVTDVLATAGTVISWFQTGK